MLMWLRHWEKKKEKLWGYFFRARVCLCILKLQQLMGVTSSSHSFSAVWLWKFAAPTCILKVFFVATSPGHVKWGCKFIIHWNEHDSCGKKNFSSATNAWFGFNFNLGRNICRPNFKFNNNPVTLKPFRKLGKTKSYSRLPLANCCEIVLCARATTAIYVVVRNYSPALLRIQAANKRKHKLI